MSGFSCTSGAFSENSHLAFSSEDSRSPSPLKETRYCAVFKTEPSFTVVKPESPCSDIVGTECENSSPQSCSMSPSYFSGSPSGCSEEEEDSMSRRDVLLAYRQVTPKNTPIVLKQSVIPVKQERLITQEIKNEDIKSEPVSSSLAELDEIFPLTDIKSSINSFNSDLDFDAISGSSGSHFEFSNVSDMLSDFGLINDHWTQC